MKIIMAILLLGFNVLANETITLTATNNVIIRGVITEATQSIIKPALLSDDSEPFYIVLDTPGGSIEAGESIIEALKNKKNLKTITIEASSMGSAIVQAIPGERLILESGTMMFHRAGGTFQGQFNQGEVESRLSHWKSIVDMMEERNAKRLNMSIKEYKEKVVNELWYTSKTALGVAADRVITIQCSKELLEGETTSLIDMGFIALKVKTSNCPLIRNSTPSAD